MSDAGDTETDEDDADGLSDATIDRVVRLTRRARQAADSNEREAYLDERAALLAEYGYTVRVREEDTGETLVFHPDEWLADGTVQMERIEDTDRAIEVPLSGTGDGDDWERIEKQNRAVADRVAAEYGSPHGETAHAFADFMSNHYAKPIQRATPAEREEFRTDYFRRNVWPSNEQREALERSLELTMDAAKTE